MKSHCCRCSQASTGPPHIGLLSAWVLETTTGEPEAGSARVCLPKALDKTDGWWKSIVTHNITHFVNKWICFDSMCVSDGVTCSLPIWTSSLPLPKHAVIYGSWALRSCVLWCLIQGPTTKEGGERGCVENSPGLGSSGTLSSDKYSLCCSLRSLWLPGSYSMSVSLDLLLHWPDNYMEADSAKPFWCAERPWSFP